MRMQSNIDSIIRNLQRRNSEFPKLMRAATAEATKELYAESKKQMKELIYDKPVPTRAEAQSERKSRREASGKTFKARKRLTTKTGKPNAAGSKPAWTRTGNLKRSEKMRLINAYVGAVENPARSKSGPYARIRHDRKKTRYPAPWRANALRVKHAAIRDIYRQAIHKAMTTGTSGRLVYLR